MTNWKSRVASRWRIVAEHVLTCFWSRDLIVSLDLVVLKPVVGIEEATSSDVQDGVKIVATWFQHLPEDA
jgi:hypothetical protein